MKKAEHSFCNMKTVFFFISIFALSLSIHAQAPLSGGPNRKYVRMDIGHGAMHCPFLSPKLETQLKNIKGVDNFFIDKEHSYSTFTLPSDTEMTLESLKKIGTDVGYPAADVIVKLDDKPIVVAEQK